MESLQEKADQYFEENPRRKEVFGAGEFLFEKRQFAQQYNSTLEEGSEVEVFENPNVISEATEDPTPPSGDAATQKPKGTTTKPKATTTKQKATTTKPKATTTKPKATATKPKATTANPNATEPQNPDAKPEETPQE